MGDVTTSWGKGDGDDSGIRVQRGQGGNCHFASCSFVMLGGKGGVLVEGRKLADQCEVH